MPTQSISLGVATTLTQNVVYATPAKPSVLHSYTAGVTITISTTVGFSSSTSLTITNGQANLPGSVFIKSTAGDAVVTLSSTAPTGTTPTESQLNSVATGTQNNWAPGIGGDTIILWSGASDMTVTGFASGIRNQRITFTNTGSAVAYFSHQSASSSAGNKLRNLITTVTPVAAGGTATWVYDGTDWRLTAHLQGTAIQIAWASGDFTASGSMTWTVEAGDIVIPTYYWVNGRICTISLNILGSSLGGTASTTLKFALPVGIRPFITSGPTGYTAIIGADNGTIATVQARVNGLTNCIEWIKQDSSNWGLSVNATTVRAHITYEVV